MKPRGNSAKRRRQRVREVRRFARQLRDRGVLISGCSLCARLTLKPGVEQAPCPVCGEMVTR